MPETAEVKGDVFKVGEELEFQIIRNVLTNRTFLVSVIDHVQPNYFDNRTASICYRIIKDYFTKYSDVPLVDVLRNEAKEVLTPRDDVELFNNQLQHIVDNVAFKDGQYLQEQILDFCKHQAIKRAMLESVDLLQQRNYAKIEEKFKKALQITGNQDIGLDYFANPSIRLVDEMKYKKRIKSGLIALDRVLGGGWSHEDTTLTIIIAPTGVGKSIFLCKFGSAAVMQGLKVLHVTHELSEQRTAGRYDSLFTAISQTERIPRHEEMLKKIGVIKSVCNGSLLIKAYPTRTCTCNMIRSMLEKLKQQEFVPDIIINDYMDIMLPNEQGSSMDDYYVQKTVSMELRAIAQEYHVPVLTASQTNRLGSDKDIIENKDVAESYAKLFASDLNLTINQTRQDLTLGKCRLYVAKFRNGKSGDVIPLTVNTEYMNVYDATTSHSGPV